MNRPLPTPTAHDTGFQSSWKPWPGRIRRRDAPRLPDAKMRRAGPAYSKSRFAEDSCTLGKVLTTSCLETKPLVPGAKFLASNAVPCPRNSLEAIGGNFFAARFAHAVSPTGATRQRAFNFLQGPAAEVRCDHRDVLFNRPDGKFHRIRRLDARRQCFRLSPCRSQNLFAFLQQEGSIYLFWRLHRCSHHSYSFPNLAGTTFILKFCPWIRMFEIIPRLHEMSKFFIELYCLIFQCFATCLGRNIVTARSLAQ